MVVASTPFAWPLRVFQLSPFEARLLVAEVRRFEVDRRSIVSVLQVSESGEDSEPPSDDPDERVFMEKALEGSQGR